MDVRLPNGHVLVGIPEGTSKEEIKDKAIAAGLANPSDFNTKDRGALEFLDVGTGLGGALGGAAAGAALGSAVPVVGTAIGAVVGGIVGGAAGTFGGEVAEDIIAGEEIDLDEATRSTAEGAAFDLAFLGAGKVIRPLGRLLGIGADDIAKKMVPPQLRELETGSLESLQQTEALLRTGGGGLSASQTGKAGKIRSIAEQIGDEGFLSGSRTRARIAKNSKVLKDEMQRQIDGVDPSFAKSVDDVGKEIFDVVMSGRKATMDLYGKGLDEIIQKYGSKRVWTVNARNAIADFETKYKTDFGTELHEETLTQIKAIKSLFEPRQMSIDSLLKAQKIIHRKIREAGDMNNQRTFNTTVEKELSELNEQVGNAISKTFDIVGKKGELASAYSSLNKMYSESLGGLLPEINKNVVSAAKTGDYVRMGKLLINSKNTSQIEAMMKSLDTAFAQVKKSGASAETIQSAADAKKIVRQSYLADFFKQAVDESDVYKLANKTKIFDNVTEAKRLKTILGDDYGQFKALLNAISESEVKKGGSIFNLALRSREAGVITGGALLGGSAGAIAGAAGILVVPEVLGRIATNRRAVTKLLELDKAYRKDPNLSPEFVASAITKIFDELSDTDRASLAYELRQPAPQNIAPVQTQQPQQPAGANQGFRFYQNQ